MFFPMLHFKGVVLSFLLTSTGKCRSSMKLSPYRYSNGCQKKVMRNLFPNKKNCIPLGCEDMRPKQGFLCISLFSLNAHNRLTLQLKWAKGQ